MRLPILLAIAAGLAPPTHAAVTPLSQNRSTNVSTSASDLDPQGVPIVTDIDSDMDTSVDFLPFVSTLAVSSGTARGSAHGSTSQYSEILAQSIIASGTSSATASSVQDGKGTSGTFSSCLLSVSLDEAATYTLSGILDGSALTTTSLSVSGPTGLIASLSAGGTQSDHLDVQQSGPAVAGTYTFSITSLSIAASTHGTQESTSGGFDITLEFASGAVGAPLVSETSAGLRAAPNPFRESTRIVTAMLADSPVRADVFDVVGRLVRALPASEADALVWDGRTGSGDRVPAGTYFVRLESPRGSSVVKVLAVR